MAAETQYTANTGIVAISTANSNLDGTGTLGTVLTAAANGTRVKSITIQAMGSTTAEGMVRFFVEGAAGARLILEVRIPIVTQAAADRGFRKNIPLNLDLQASLILKASTQIANTFNIIAEGMDWAYNANVRPESTNYVANTGFALMTVGNSNLDGTTGTVSTVFTAGTSAIYKGCNINSITIKAQVSTTIDGMIRIFIQNTASTVTKLFMEIPVAVVTATATLSAFGYRIKFPNGGFNLQAGYKILATTENSNAFSITVEGKDWKYPTGNTLGYNLYAQLATNIVNPADATTYYFGSNTSTALATTVNEHRIYITAAGTIDACYLFCTTVVAFASAETSMVYIRLNNSTDSAVNTIVLNAAATSSFSTGLNIPVVAGDYIELKWITPTWATNPSGVIVSAQIHIKANL